MPGKIDQVSVQKLMRRLKQGVNAFESMKSQVLKVIWRWMKTALRRPKLLNRIITKNLPNLKIVCTG